MPSSPQPLGSPAYSALDAVKPYGAYVRFNEFLALTGMKKSTAFAILSPDSPYHDPSMPPGFQLTRRTKVWKTEEVIAWVESKRVGLKGNVSEGGC